jgi:hypothetical protein
MADAVRAGDVERARAWRARLAKPRGVSSTQGALILQTLPAGPAQRADAARELVREAVTWQTTRARQLLDEAARSTRRQDVPMPGRLAERLTEAAVLADVPAPLREAAGLPPVAPAADVVASASASVDPVAAVLAEPWDRARAATDVLRRALESRLPSLLTDAEKARRERLACGTGK